MQEIQRGSMLDAFSHDDGLYLKSETFLGTTSTAFSLAEGGRRFLTVPPLVWGAYSLHPI